MKRITLALFVALSVQPVMAKSEVKDAVKVQTTAPQGADVGKLHAELKEKYPELLIDELTHSPVKGIYQARIGAQMVYITEDGQFIFNGDIIDMNRPKEDQNITEIARRSARAEMLKGLKSSDMIIYGPTVNPKGIITVFTDVDCGYSKKLHEEIPDLIKEGIQVRYLAYPRSGLNSPSYEKTVSIWCAKNPQEAFDRAAKGDSITATTCLNTIASQMEIGMKFGVRGTPTIVFQDGFLLPGYLPADKLAEEAISHTSGVLKNTGQMLRKVKDKVKDKVKEKTED